MTAPDGWLAAMWPVLRAHLPGPPARVLELGCGKRGGFVARLDALGYSALGVDPEAPEGAAFRRAPFEDLDRLDPVDVVVASLSLHHVRDQAQVLDRIAEILVPGGRLIAIEWAWEDFDEATARWCFERLEPDGEDWLHRRRDGWVASGRPWDEYFPEWARTHEIHRFGSLLPLLDDRFAREHLEREPYFFPNLAATTEQDERAAIEAGEIRAARVDYAGRLDR